jgi:hypothetical protein
MKRLLAFSLTFSKRLNSDGGAAPVSAPASSTLDSVLS